MELKETVNLGEHKIEKASFVLYVQVTWLSFDKLFIVLHVPFIRRSKNIQYSRGSSGTSCLVLMTFCQIQLFACNYFCVDVCRCVCACLFERLIRKALIQTVLK